MAELLTPGVIIQEVPFGPQPIEGVSTSTAGFVGGAERGPDSGPPTLVTSLPDYQRKFGGYGRIAFQRSGSPTPPVEQRPNLAYYLQAFFDNGGRRAYVSRVVGASASSASRPVNHAAYEVRLTSTSQVLSGNDVRFALSSVVGVGIGPAQLTLVRKSDGATVAAEVLAVESVTSLVTIDDPGVAWRALGPDTHYVRIAPGSASALAFTVMARDKGAFGARISVLVEPVLVNRVSIVTRFNDTTYAVASVTPFSTTQRVQLTTAGETARRIDSIASVNAGTNQLVLATGSPTDFTGGSIWAVVWRVSVLMDGVVVETLDGVPSNLAGASADAFRDDVNARSNWVRIAAGAVELDPVANRYPTFLMGQPALLSTGGSDGTVNAGDLAGIVAARTGIGALEALDGVNLIAAPGFSDEVSVVNTLISQAERLKDRFAVFETGSSLVEVPTALSQRGQYNSQYAAMYHPWVRVRDPLTGLPLSLAPGAHMLGCFARTDNERGVFKAPANVVIRGILGFTQEITNGEQDVLNPAGVNVLRRFDGLGNVVWGARTVSADTLWKYVSVRRLFIFLEQSIARGTRYAVFEPNALPLWARIRDSVTNFLTTQWRSGALFGATPEEAFFVKVDETTTTQDDRDNGIVNILVGIAPVKPAEFVVFQIGQAPSSVIIAEG